MNRNYCNKHHLYYSAIECPFCVFDKFHNIGEKKRSVVLDDREMDTKLKDLLNKYNAGKQ